MCQVSPEQDSFTREIAGRLASRGVGGAAMALLSGGRPLTFFLAQLLWVAQPAASLLLPRTQIAALAQLLEDEQAVTQLQRYLRGEEG